MKKNTLAKTYLTRFVGSSSTLFILISVIPLFSQFEYGRGVFTSSIFIMLLSIFLSQLFCPENYFGLYQSFLLFLVFIIYTQLILKSVSGSFHDYEYRCDLRSIYLLVEYSLFILRVQGKLTPSFSYSILALYGSLFSFVKDGFDDVL